MKHDKNYVNFYNFLFADNSHSSVVRLQRKRMVWLLLPFTILLGCSHQDEQVQKVSRPVKAVRIANQATANVMRFAGEVRPRYESDLSFRVPGKIIGRPVEEGDRVRKGQLLARLDSSDYRLAVEALKAQLKSAEAERNFARDDLNRYRELLDQQVVSPPELDRRETVYTAARERAAALQAQLAQAANQLDYTDLLADRDGVVTTLAFETGQVVNAGQPLIKLAQLDEKEVHIDVPEQYVAGIKSHQDVVVTLWAAGDRRIPARIREIAAAADPASRTYRIKVTLLDRSDEARLGMTATVWIPSNTAEKIAVPLSAIFTSQHEPGQPRVWLVNEQGGAVKSVPVQTGETLAGERIAVQGLAPGQLIVSAGVQRLAEGQTVRVLEDVLPVKQSQVIENKEQQP